VTIFVKTDIIPILFFDLDYVKSRGKIHTNWTRIIIIFLICAKVIWGPTDPADHQRVKVLYK